MGHELHNILQIFGHLTGVRTIPMGKLKVRLAYPVTLHKDEEVHFI